jgi:hypothetical protein
VYETREIRARPRSSTDGKPIVRLKASLLESLIAADHPSEWSAYSRDGRLPAIDDVTFDDGDEGEKTVSEINDGPSELLAPEPCDAFDPDEAYDALPGFEDV